MHTKNEYVCPFHHFTISPAPHTLHFSNLLNFCQSERWETFQLSQHCCNLHYYYLIITEVGNLFIGHKPFVFPLWIPCSLFFDYFFSGLFIMFSLIYRSSLLQSVNEYLLSTFCVPDTRTRNIAVNKQSFQLSWSKHVGRGNR